METEDTKNTGDIKQATADLYWLAFLLTGCRDLSIEVAADAATSGDDTNSFFADWLRGWQRRLVIAKALAAIHDELADSARRTDRAHLNSRAPAPRNWSLSPDTTREELEQALLAIDLFPRATLLLLVFESVRIADAATLLDATPDLLKKAQVIGLRELAAILANSKEPTVSGSPQSEGRATGSAESKKRFFGSMRTAAVCR